MKKIISIVVLATLAMGCEFHSYDDPHYRPSHSVYVEPAYPVYSSATEISYCSYEAQYTQPFNMQPYDCEYSYYGQCCTWSVVGCDETWCWYDDACGWEYAGEHCSSYVY
jgi:hypothetical protein